MLNLELLHKENNTLVYESDVRYVIRHSSARSYYILTVDSNDTEPMDYACDSLAVAFASIEALENGEEI